MILDVEKTTKEAVEKAFTDYELTIGMTLKEAVEKQIPKKPTGDYHSCPHYRCPNCHSSVKMYEADNTYPHCAFCGQKLDWSGANG
jgi:ribosomal protein S27E